MSERRLVSSRSSRAALGVFCGGMLLLGGCAYIYDFGQYGLDPDGGAPSGSGPGAGGSTASSASGGGEGIGGGGGGDCKLADPKCQIEELSKSTVVYGDIALGETVVYWIDDQGLSKQVKDKSAPAQAILGNFDPVTLLAAAKDTEIYYFANNKLFKQIYDLDSTVFTTEDVSSKPGAGLLLYKDEIYWSVVSEKKIYKTKAETDVSATADEPLFLAANPGGPEVYWTFKGSGPDGGVQTPGKLDFVQNQNAPSGIVTDGDSVFWITAEGKIHGVEKTGGTATVKDGVAILGNAVVPSGRIVENGSRVYWLGPDSTTCTVANGCTCDPKEKCGVVWTALKTSLDAPEPFARAAWTNLRGLAADSMHIYWTASTGATSQLLRKPALP